MSNLFPSMLASERHALKKHYHQSPFLNNLRLRRLPSTILILLPISQHVPNPRAIGQLVHLLKVFLRDLERLGGDVGDVFTDELAWVDARLIDLLQQEASEGFDAGAQEGAVEWYVDAPKRDGCKATLELDGFGLGFGFFGASLNDFYEVFFDLV